MNERIRELALQAWMAERTEKDPEYKKSKNTEYLLKNMEDFHKKFAELIVAECIEQIKTQGIGASSEDYGDYEIGFNAGLFHALRSIKEHFGIEE